MGENNTISLCMITRNEEKNLVRCLRSVYKFVDEIIVVDTGSTDSTKEVAARYGARVYEYPWENNFARARNESLRYASGDWILIMDADEELPGETARNIKKLAKQNEIEGWYFTIYSPVSAGEDSPANKSPNLRMFKNKEIYRFEGRVHEQIKPSILRENPGARIEYSNLVILHYGYRQDISGRKEKTIRNIELLQEELQDRPDDSFVNFNLGNSYFVLKDYIKSCEYYRTAMQNINVDAVYKPLLFRNLCLCLVELGEYSEALKLLEEGLALYPDYPDLYFLQGQIYWDIGYPEKARRNFLKCTYFNEEQSAYTTTDGVTSYLAFENIAETYAREGNYKQAAEYLSLILRNRSSLRLLSRLCFFLKKRGLQGNQLLDYLRSKFTISDLSLARVLYNCHEYEASISCIDQYLRRKPDFYFAIILKAKVLLKQKKYQQTKKLLQGIPEHAVCSENELFRVYIILNCLAYWLDSPRQNAGHYLKEFKVDNRFLDLLLACEIVNITITGKQELSQNMVHKIDENIFNHLINLSLQALIYGDLDLALMIGATATKDRSDNSYKPEQPATDCYYYLGRAAIENGLFREGKALVLRSLNQNIPEAVRYYYLGLACMKLKQHDEAFHYFYLAGRMEPGKKIYTVLALDQLISFLFSLTIGLKNQTGSRPDIYNLLMTLASLKKRLKMIGEGKKA